MKYQKNGSIGYVGQTPVLFKCSVIENILIGRPLDQKKLDFALKYSCLERDVQIWKDGLEHKLSGNGMNISGGQKSRLAFARALYSDFDILVLDDLTSALDPETTQFILSETIGRVLKGKTVIMSTNDMSVLKFADYIYYIEDGKFIHQGDFASIQTSELWLKQQELLDQIQHSKDALVDFPEDQNDDCSANPEKESDEDVLISKVGSKDELHSQSKIKPFIVLGQDFGLILYLLKDLGGWSNLIIIIAFMSFDRLINDFNQNNLMSWSEIFQNANLQGQFLKYFAIELISPVIIHVASMAIENRNNAMENSLTVKMEYKFLHAPIQGFFLITTKLT